MACGTMGTSRLLVGKRPESTGTSASRARGAGQAEQRQGCLPPQLSGARQPNRNENRLEGGVHTGLHRWKVRQVCVCAYVRARACAAPHEHRLPPQITAHGGALWKAAAPTQSSAQGTRAGPACTEVPPQDTGAERRPAAASASPLSWGRWAWSEKEPAASGGGSLCPARRRPRLGRSPVRKRPHTVPRVLRASPGHEAAAATRNLRPHSQLGCSTAPTVSTTLTRCQSHFDS